ncbi:MAG: prohibitin family protein [Oligoflexia bacterium]|nr:prohibitin family protein [Oligoflexia bacterium]MBF0366289.1 prohibitin family protein [Oligoflexia bacterium]
MSYGTSRPPNIDFKAMGGLLALGIIGVIILIIVFTSSYIIDPGHRGVLITMGKVHPQFAPEGFGFKMPLLTSVISFPIRQQTQALKTECYSSDLQQVNVSLKILFRTPEQSVVKIYQEYAGDPFDTLIAPRITEALKDVSALQSAEMIVKKRDDIKAKTLESARQKLGNLLTVEDIVIEDIALTPELEAAIEAKMVQEQEAAKAKFTQQKAEIEANIAIIRAKGEAQAIQVRGQALRDNPALIQLQIVEKWDGKTPTVVGGGTGGGANILLPLGK